MPFDNIPLAPPKEWATPFSGLTDKQLASIGSVVTAWSTLDAVLQSLLYRLATAPPALGQALTEDLGADNRLKALKRLIRSWRYMFEIAEPTEIIAALDAVESVVKWVAQNKTNRNIVAHYQWMRKSDEEMFAWKYSLEPLAGKVDNKSNLTSPEKLMEFAAETTAYCSIALAAYRVLASLPPWPKTQEL